MRNEAHPDTELLDRLRAGLLDEDLEMKARLERHLAACPSCRERLNAWEHLGRDALGAWAVTEDSLSAGLGAARQRALAAGRHRRFVSRRPLLATAAVVLIAVSAGLWTLRHEFVDTVHVTAQNSAGVPDLYEDLDFYLWMANQGDDKMHEQGSNGNS
jgi:anti-sigma factor RsiW